MYSMKTRTYLANLGNSELGGTFGYIFKFVSPACGEFKVQTYASNCCGFNLIYGFSSYSLLDPARVTALIKLLSEYKWEEDTGFRSKHFMFSCGVGPHGNQQREEFYQHLIDHPYVSQIHEYPSASEPGHNIGLFLITLP